jgi:hypothetical protein
VSRSRRARRLARTALLQAGDVRLRLLLAGLVLSACSAGTSPFESCVEHSVEEGVDRTAAEAACQDMTED